VALLDGGGQAYPRMLQAIAGARSTILLQGVRLREASVLHAKMATVDGRWLLVGSFNLDPFSLANMETLVQVDDGQVVARGEAWIEEHLAGSRVATALEAGSMLRRWALDPLAGCWHDWPAWPASWSRAGGAWARRVGSVEGRPGHRHRSRPAPLPSGRRRHVPPYSALTEADLGLLDAGVLGVAGQGVALLLGDGVVGVGLLGRRILARRHTRRRGLGAGVG